MDAVGHRGGQADRALPGSCRVVWKPMKCSTRQDATASIGDHEVPASAVATSATKLGTASFSVSALASSWATNANVGEPLNTVVAAPAAPDVQPVPMPASGMAPHRAAVFPMLQLQLGPGAIPSASTSATRVVTTDVVVGAATAATGAAEGNTAGTVTGVVTGGLSRRRSVPGPWPS